MGGYCCVWLVYETWAEQQGLLSFFLTVSIQLLECEFER